MNLGERIALARKHAKLTQPALAEKLNGLMTQQNISLLERGVIKGTEYIVQIAMVCGVRPEWLATGQGEMTDGLYVEDIRIKKAVLLMQELPDYALDEAIKGLDSVSKLSKMAK
jgi:transcriptional regulator with XRE-family HTH domain